MLWAPPILRLFPLVFQIICVTNFSKYLSEGKLLPTWKIPQKASISSRKHHYSWIDWSMLVNLPKQLCAIEHRCYCCTLKTFNPITGKVVEDEPICAAVIGNFGNTEICSSRNQKAYIVGEVFGQIAAHAARASLFTIHTPSARWYCYSNHWYSRLMR